jgi:hypothetical protein
MTQPEATQEHTTDQSTWNWSQPPSEGGRALATVDAVDTGDSESRSAANSLVESAIAACLHAKHGRSGSAETLAAYSRTIAEFRALLRERSLDLDAADPRRVRTDLVADGPALQATEDEGVRCTVGTGAGRGPRVDADLGDCHAGASLCCAPRAPRWGAR